MQAKKFLILLKKSCHYIILRIKRWTRALTLKLHQWDPRVLLSESVAARYGKMKRKSMHKGKAEALEPTVAHILL